MVKLNNQKNIFVSKNRFSINIDILNNNHLTSCIEDTLKAFNDCKNKQKVYETMFFDV